jgi:hypothetical protein
MSCRTSTAPPLAVAGVAWARKIRGASVAPRRHLDGSALLTPQGRTELADDARLAYGFDVMTPDQIAFQIQHPARGVVHEPKTSLAVDDQHTLDHARQDRGHSRALGLQLGHAPRHLRHFHGRAPRRHARTPPGDRDANPRAQEACRDRGQHRDDQGHH